ncbi:MULTISPECIES: helix-turn-helix domain-containing protein [Citrobacter]|uniref:helix-turn-helix domain-containing protein n=1 Tax=Citrobacter TaxID=544 RepID=UPI0006BA5FB1|nr:MULTISPECIES: helix-turn-helix domain-containing protein [Citrobacter]HCD2000348.1 helix-turn-helix domain-containing protein [Citrobacter farmeri]ELB4226854.1 helix-turn-helix domain-containing protein [Citrobacter amalonaticus]ELK6621925.1 helix-turn-helix domain-containing protein [Citrobacter amalonaticus]MCK8152397.1 helix-turn-helix domain-containing protein [Citrobacter amalonaticus]MDM3524775.1 helix-turn-helix domain-containing protein [Citrobacter sp. Ca226]
MNINTTIAARLKQMREQKNMSQAKLAELCGWAQSRIGNYEAGRRNIGVDDALTISNALGINPAELMFGDDHAESWLTPKHRKLIALFDQLPESEQDRMIDTFQLRLKEIDEYVEKYLRGRFKPADE